MADYKDIVGTAVRNNAGNLSADQRDQIFYDSTNVDFKYQFATTATSWRTGVSMNTARWLGGGAGTETAGLAFGGEVPPNTATVNTESWNGSTWTEVNNLNVATFGTANIIGTYTSSLAAGGNPARSTNESWNGSSWTELGDLNTGRHYFGGAGADNTAAVVFGGTSPPGVHAQTEVWNGSAWTEVNDLNTGRRNLAGAGVIYTAALGIGGGPQPSANSEVEQWDGSSWTEVGDINTARQYGGANGSSAKALFYGGNGDPPFSAKTESWNGSSWTEIADLSTARGAVSSAGTLNTSA